MDAATKVEREQRPRPLSANGRSGPEPAAPAAVFGGERATELFSAERTGLPAADGSPGVQRAAGLAAADLPAPARARLTGAMQRSAGNARTGTLLGAAASSSAEPDASPEPAAPAPLAGAPAASSSPMARAAGPELPAPVEEPTSPAAVPALPARAEPAASVETEPSAEIPSAPPETEPPAEVVPSPVDGSVGAPTEAEPVPPAPDEATTEIGGRLPASQLAEPVPTAGQAPLEPAAATGEPGAAPGMAATVTVAPAGGDPTAGPSAGGAPPSAPPAGGPVAVDTGGGAEPEAGGDEEAAADELEEKLEASAPPDEAEEFDAAVPEPVEPPTPEPSVPESTEPPALKSSSDTAPSAATEPAPPAEPPAPAVAPEPASVPSAEEEVEPAAAEAEPAQLSPAEVDVATGAMAEGGGSQPGGGGGGGGSALPEPPKPETPDVSGLEPEAALAEAGSAPPAQLAAALGGVRETVGTSVAAQRADLAASPPTVERPAGRGAGGPDRASPAPARTPGRDAVAKVPEGRDTATTPPSPLPEPPAPPVDAVPEPAVESTPEGGLTQQDAARVQESVDALPQTDPALHATAGPAPQVPLDGNTDPARVDEQRTNLRAGVESAAAEGRAAAAADLGENDVYDDQPAQTLAASVAPRGAGGGGGSPGTGAPAGEEAEAASIIAGQEKGSEIASAVLAARTELAARKQEHGEQVAQEKLESAAEIAALEQADAREQDGVRRGVKAEVAAKRGQWTAEQEATVAAANKDADEKVSAARKTVDAEKKAADDTARTEITKGDAEAAQARIAAEQEAARKKKEAEEESSGVLGWLASKAKSFFNKIKSAIKKAFDYARRAVKAAIKKAKELAARAIEWARRKIVDAIKAVGAALIAIGDRVLKNFPTLRAKFRKAITSTVDAAVAKVNKLAAKLNAAIQKALDTLGNALDAALGLLEKGLLAAVDAVASAVDGALKFANAVVQGLAVFAVLVRDVSSGPIQWLKNLAAGAVDGIRNHLWGAFKSAVSEWFTAKIEQVLGLGAAVWRVLTSGGLSVAQIGRMAWEGIKSMIPAMVIRILIEKLVSMIVPAAGAVMLIIEGLKAAWGTVGRILTAFSKFIEFLKAVKAGTAGPAFAAMLAAAAVAVIDFIANWLIAELVKGAAKVAGKLKGLARRLLQKKRAKAARRRHGKAPSDKQGRAGKGKADEAAARKKAERKKKHDARAEAATVAAVSRMLDGRGTSDLAFRARLLWLKVRWGWSQLRLERHGEGREVVGARSDPKKLPTPKIEHNVEVVRDLKVSVKGGHTARIVVGEAADVAPGVRREAMAVRMMGLQRFGQQWGYNEGAPGRLESAGRVNYLKKISPTENISEVSISPEGKIFPTEYADPKSKLGSVKPDVGWAERRIAKGKAKGKLDLISIPEVTMVGNWALKGTLARYAFHKSGQFVGYLSAAKVRIKQLQDDGKAVPNVEVHIHYISDTSPSDETVTFMTNELKKAGLPNVTVFWGRI